MEQYALYLVLKEIVKNIDTSFKYSFNDMDSNKDKVVGIYIKGSNPSEYRTLADGEYLNINNRVQFLIQGGLDNNSLMSCLSLCSEIKNTLIKTFNKYITVPSQLGIDSNGKIVIKTDTELESITLMISKVDLLSDILDLGKSEQGKPRYSINFKIKYELGGN